MGKLFVNSVRLNKDNIDNNIYPFNIKCINNFRELKIDNAVTLFYGENGVGKSTFIEAVAIALGLNPEGGSNNVNYPPPEGGWACNYPVVVAELTSDLFLNEKVLIGDVASQGD